MRKTFALVASLLVTLWAGLVFTSTQNAVPKYNSGGSLVDSIITEVSGQVGIGTTAAPANTLEVNGDIGVSSTGWIGPRGGNIKWYGYMPLGALTVNGTTENHGGFLAHYSSGSSSSGRKFFIGRTANSTTYTAEMTFDLDGNVGIGTTTPSSKLHVAGNVTVDGNIGAKYQDVAEWVSTSEPVSAGMVVSADANGENRVRPSREQYDTAVAGVVSAKPGVLLGEAGTGKVAVAQSGRVKVRVDATYGEIRPGDLLVTSPVVGYAMRSEPITVGDTSMHRPGTILGKALGSLATGQGEVLVLLTLQ